MAGTTTDLSVVIVSWNVRDLLRQCLRSVYDTIQHLHFEVFVVDNASHDGSPEMVQTEFPQVQLIVNPENLGFGRANNQALALCRGRYVLLLNPDTLVPPGAVESMVSFVEAHPRAGLVGPELFDGKGRLLINFVRWTPRHIAEYIVESVASLGHESTRVIFRQPRRVCILTGACWLARYEAMAEIGFYDEGFFMYAEEPDVCTRLHDAGWEIWFLRDVEVVHYKKQSVRQRGWGWDLLVFFRSMALWLRKRWWAKRSGGRTEPPPPAGEPALSPVLSSSKGKAEGG